MARESTDIDDIDETYEADDFENINLNMGQAEAQNLSRRRIEELREEKELYNSIWDDMDLP